MDPAKLTTSPEWFATPSTLVNAPGMHRFVWPLRYLLPAVLTRTPSAYSDGVWAPPGAYRVVLTVDGRSLSQPLTIAPDPRVHLSAAAYAEQFALAREVEALRVAVAHRLEADEAQIKKLPPDDPERTRLIESSGYDPATADQWWVPVKSTTSLRYYEQALSKLAEAVDTADVAPTVDAKEALAKLRVAVEGHR